MKPDDDQRISISFRLTKATVSLVKAFVRDHAGKPKYLKLGPFVEQAILAQIERTKLDLDDQSERRPSIALGRQRLAPSNINNRRTTTTLHGDNP